ncbi:Histone-lysine N-methyltransferase [Bertholletia excelsa]
MDEQCNYYVDVKCAFLPRTAKHEVHRHTLALRQGLAKCNACGHEYRASRYLCGSCKYNICIGCILFPQTIGHRYDKHPFALMHDTSLLDHVDDEYYCEICEEEIDIKYWFYHCNDCNQSLHTRCIRPTWWRFDFGNNWISLKHVKHPHHLKIVEEVTLNYPCAYCHKYYVDEDGKVYKCTTCNSWTHPRCIKMRITI